MVFIADGVFIFMCVFCVCLFVHNRFLVVAGSFSSSNSINRWYVRCVGDVP